MVKSTPTLAMSQRVTEQTYWIVANGADTEEVAQIIQSALIQPGN